MTWADATSYCASLDLGGRTDWRLPARIELASRLDLTSPSSDNSAADVFPSIPETFWTCSQGAANPFAAWRVDFYTGSTFTTEKVSSLRVRCIAGAATDTPPPSRYETTALGEVLDTRTALHWATSISTFVNWGQAYELCRARGPGWRLPALVELQTLVDEAQVISAVDPIAFTDRPDEYYWTSSLLGGTFSWAWFVSMGEGNTFWIPTTELHHARCVR